MLLFIIYTYLYSDLLLNTKNNLFYGSISIDCEKAFYLSKMYDYIVKCRKIISSYNYTKKELWL